MNNIQKSKDWELFEEMDRQHVEEGPITVKGTVVYGVSNRNNPIGVEPKIGGLYVHTKPDGNEVPATITNVEYQRSISNVGKGNGHRYVMNITAVIKD